VQEHAGAGGVRVDVDVVEAAVFEGGGAADDAVDLVPLREQELDQVRPSWPVTPVISALSMRVSPGERCRPLLGGQGMYPKRG